MSSASKRLKDALRKVQGPEDMVYRCRSSGDIEGLAELQVAAAIFLGRTDLLMGTYRETLEDARTEASGDVSLLDLAIKFGARGFAKELAELGVPLNKDFVDNSPVKDGPALVALLSTGKVQPDITNGVSSLSFGSLSSEDLPEGHQWMALQMKNPTTYNAYPYLQNPKAWKRFIWFNASKFHKVLEDHGAKFTSCIICGESVSTTFHEHVTSRGHFDCLCGKLHGDYDVAYEQLWQTFEGKHGEELRYNHAVGKIQTDL